MTERPESRWWDKHINVPTLIAIGTTLATFAYGYGRLSEQIEINRSLIEDLSREVHTHAGDSDQHRRTAENLKELWDNWEAANERTTDMKIDALSRENAAQHRALTDRLDAIAADVRAIKHNGVK